MHARVSVTRYVELLFDNSAMLKYMIAYQDLQSTNQIAMLDPKISKYYKVFIVHTVRTLEFAMTLKSVIGRYRVNLHLALFF